MEKCNAYHHNRFSGDYLEYLTDMIKHLIPYETDYPFPLIIAMVVGIGLSILTAQTS